MDKKLHSALLEKEKYEAYLANLEKLHADKLINDTSFKSLKNEYSVSLRKSLSQVELVKSEINHRLQTSTRKLAVYRQELSNLEARHKVGQISAGDYLKVARIPESRVSALESIVAHLTALMAAAHSSEIAVKAETGLASLFGLKGKDSVPPAYPPPVPEPLAQAPVVEAPFKPAEEVRVSDGVLVSGLTILPELVQPGATVGVIATFINTERYTVTHRAEFKVNSRLEAINDITLESGKSGELTFMTLAGAPGLYVVSIDAVDGQLKVMPFAYHHPQ